MCYHTGNCFMISHRVTATQAVSGQAVQRNCLQIAHWREERRGNLSAPLPSHVSLGSKIFLMGDNSPALHITFSSPFSSCFRSQILNSRIWHVIGLQVAGGTQDLSCMQWASGGRAKRVPWNQWSIQMFIQNRAQKSHFFNYSYSCALPNFLESQSLGKRQILLTVGMYLSGSQIFEGKFDFILAQHTWH